VVVTAGPAASIAMTVDDRRRTYQDVLVGTAKSVVDNTPGALLVALSAFTVYGTAAEAT